MKVYKIFLSSPGDCSDKRRAVNQVVEQMNRDPLVSSTGITIEVVAWDWGYGVPLDLLGSPQASVNKRLSLPEECNLFVGIFNEKLGTPLPANEFRKSDGTPFLSGSEYELHRACNARRRGASKPEILIYRHVHESPSETDQYKNLEDFFSKPPFKDDGNWIGSVNRIPKGEDFTAAFDQHLRKLISNEIETDLSFEKWLERQASRLTRYAGPRYTKDAHVESDIGKSFDWLLARKAAIEELDQALLEIFEKLVDEVAFDSVKSEMEIIAAWMRDNIWWQETPSLPSIVETLSKIEPIAWEELKKLERSEEPDKGAKNSSFRRHSLEQLSFRSRDAIELLEKYSPLTSVRVLLLTGPAGQGKTHTLIHEVNKAIAENGIAVGVMGQTLGQSGEVWTSICNKLEWNGSHIEFLDKLESEAAENQQRALIVIDALNEGPFRLKWKTELLGMIDDVLHRPHLALAISVRDDYFDYVMPQVDRPPWVRIEHNGFSGVEPKALAKYFDHYRVKAPIAPPVGEFDNPLFVRLLAKSLQSRQFAHWLPSWMQVWEAWMASLEEDAKDRIGLDDPSRKQPIRRTLIKLAQHVFDSESGGYCLPRSEADEIGMEITGSNSVIAFLCSSGALIDRLNDEDDEVIEFGFERLSDTFLADRIMSKLFHGLSSKPEKLEALRKSFEQGGALEPIINRELWDDPLAQRRAGLLQAICIASPSQTGVELPQILSLGEYDWELAFAFTESLRWRSEPDEFGLEGKELYGLWQQVNSRALYEEELNDLISFALIPGHPFSMDHILHPWLMEQESVGARDACWSTQVTSIWLEDNSALKTVANWAASSDLTGAQFEIALPASKLLAWCCSSSQQELREKSIRGLTRLLAACPAVAQQLLPDFLKLNDMYVLEGVCVAVWGMTLANPESDAAKAAVNIFFEAMFSEGIPSTTHITIRHYARKIIEQACKFEWVESKARDISLPPYSSSLPLDRVPQNNEALEALDDSRGFKKIYYSCVEHGDFYRYVMGGNNVTLVFSSLPLATSTEPERPFNPEYSTLGAYKAPSTFDIALASRFIVWNALQIGWTAERFEDFDNSHQVTRAGRITLEHRTERIGKKYQWIGWMSFLGFLADNYQMSPEFGDEPRNYESPTQIGYIHLYDPSRWLASGSTSLSSDTDESKLWDICNMPKWPQPDSNEMQIWADSALSDLSLSDLILESVPLPESWGDGPWIRIAAEHIWNTKFAPGQWGVRQKFMADIWCQVSPRLIRSEEFALMISAFETESAQTHLAGMGRNDLPGDWDTSLTDWPAANDLFDGNFIDTSDDQWGDYFPVPWKWVIGKCGHPDKKDEHQPFMIPTPEIFNEWVLSIDTANNTVCKDGKPVFGLVGDVSIFAHKSRLQELLTGSNYRLIWLVSGERRSFLSWGLLSDQDKVSAWVDIHAVLFLGLDSEIHTAWYRREPR